LHDVQTPSSPITCTSLPVKNRLCLLLTLLAPLHGAAAQIPPDAKLEKIATGFQFVEGPVWKDGVGLLFSDIWPSIIYKWSESDSSVSIYLKPSDSSNGLTFDHQGDLILTQMQTRRIARQEANGTITPLATRYNGGRFNSPNDIVVTSMGSIYFTDPDFNTPAGEPKELSFKGIFRLSPAGFLKVMDSTFDKPNGICFSPDESRLYVNESPQHKIYEWDVLNDSTIANKRVFYTIPQAGYADGMKTDPEGNVYCTGPGGVWVVSPSGTYLGTIATPETPTNCAWGESDRKTLYITAGTSLYRIRLNPATGVKEGARPGELYGLGANFPNPFNPTTSIQFTLRDRQSTTLKIYDLLGRAVATLINEMKDPGRYTVMWDASGYSSGVYLYRMEAGAYVASRRMMMLR
jgi:gluconolactonase